MKYFPIFLDANYITAMIIGGGEVASRKIELLLKSTVNITIMSKDVCASVERLINLHQLTWLKHNYQVGHLSGINLVIAATDDSLVNKAIAEEARTLDMLTNVVDQPALCTYITPAIIDRSPMIVALSSSGSSPILIRMLREQIEKTLPQGYGKLADFSYKFREHVKARVKGLRNRRSFWENTLRGPIGQAILDGKQRQAEQQLIASIKQEIAPPCGEIIFIHTKDGNPDNLTLNAHRAMQFADAVFYDNQVNTVLIEYIRRDAEKFPQTISAEISLNYQHAIELAKQGKRVLYLLAGNEALPKNEALSASNVMIQELISGN
ncbi:MAG: siroheme synthase [Colwellia sp.]|jgi:siroheme synthase-like protein|nr:siroheme synthase [Colwellia sp.]